MSFQSNIIAQSQDSINVVYLKTGKVVKGHIITMTPNVEIKFKTLDGCLIIYSYDDFLKLEKEKSTYTTKNQREMIVFEKETGKAENESIKLDKSGVTDKLILKDGRVFDCRIQNEDSEFIYLSIFKNGKEIKTQVNKNEVKEIQKGE